MSEDQTALVHVPVQPLVGEHQVQIDRRTSDRRKDITPPDPTMVRSMTVMSEKLYSALDKLEAKANAMDSSTKKILIIVVGVLLTCSIVAGTEIYNLKQQVRIEQWRQTSRVIAVKNEGNIEDVKRQNEALMKELQMLKKTMEERKPKL